jgi:hypothetical protein
MFTLFNKKAKDYTTGWWGPIGVAILSLWLVVIYHCIWPFWVTKFVGIVFIVIVAMRWEQIKDNQDMTTLHKDKLCEKGRFISLRNQAALFVRITFMIGIVTLANDLMQDIPEPVTPSAPQPMQNITINNYSNSFNNNDNSFNNTITDTPPGPAKRKVHHSTHRVPNCKKVPG